MLGEVLNEVLDEVAPHGGAWIEITSTARIYAVARSPLTEGRGLKCQRLHDTLIHIMSPLTEGRGLKCRPPEYPSYRGLVAPHGGAWIEIFLSLSNHINHLSPLTEGRGLKSTPAPAASPSPGRPSRRGVD